MNVARQLDSFLTAHLPSTATALAIALSGGGDSAALLVAAVERRRDLRAGGSLRAIHVDHGLQPASVAFAQACVELCARLGVPVTVLKVRVETSAGASLEAAARDARYGALAGALAPGECLLTAHHREDQAETVLLQLLRGAGLKGMSAMPVSRPLGRGLHLRPFLERSQAELLAYAAAAGVTPPPADPMNADPRFDRAFLRTRLWPLLTERWPAAAVALSRTARHVAEAQELLDRAAAVQLLRLRDGDALSVAGLRGLPPGEQINVLRYWIAGTGTPPPSSARLGEALRQMLAAGSEQSPAVEWGGAALRRYRERLFLTPAKLPQLGVRRDWFILPGSRVDLGPGLGKLRWVPRTGGLDPARLPDTLTVRRRAGGESLKPARRAKTQSVQHLCQALGVLPWMRDALPLVYAGDALIAIADLWTDARWCAPAGAAGFACAWDDAPILV